MSISKKIHRDSAVSGVGVGVRSEKVVCFYGGFMVCLYSY